MKLSLLSVLIDSEAEEGNESVIDSCASKLKNLMETAQDESAALSQN